MPVRTSIIAIVFALCSAVASAEPQHTKDSLDKVKKQVEENKAVLVDVREPSEWDRGHVEGAVLVPLRELAKKSKDAAFAAELEQKLPKDKTIYCHCAKGKRALLAAEVFEKLGYTDVRPLGPGYEQLLGAGFPKAEQK
jgi:rhodanese-related sulfurtransferase